LSSHLEELFEDETLVKKIKMQLPYLFQLAEIECSRAGKIGMQVGSLRESIIVALLLYKFGEENVETEVPITAPEVDAKLFGQPISIKTITSKGFSGVKINWTVDPQKVKEFCESYQPICDMLFVKIAWNAEECFYYIPLNVQRRVLKEMGTEKFIKPPKLRTNPRGPEFTAAALSRLVTDERTKAITINWQRMEVDYNPYKRWLDYWKE